MNLTVVATNPSDLEADYLVLVLDESRRLFQVDDGEYQDRLNAQWDAIKAKRIKRPDVLPAPPQFAASAVLCTAIEMGSRKNYPECERVRAVSHEIFKYCEGVDKSCIAVLLNGEDGPSMAAWIAEGFALGSYTFNDYRSARKFTERLNVQLVVRPEALAEVEQRVSQSLFLAECQNLARDLINKPGSVAVPSFLAEQAARMAEAAGLECEIFDDARLAAEGYNGLLAVGKGGNHPPRMIVLRHRPANASAAPHLCLVGKGLTFDTGGLCIKSGTAMWEMISDMSGAAAVLASMKAIANAKPALNITGIMVCAQNDVDANSTKPGDCFIAKNGKSVHVLNTDAEGRLILTDGLHRAGEEGATHVVDVATLTGACARALGESLSGLFSNDAQFQEVVRSTGESEGELMWPLPLLAEYRGLLDHYRTDINNTSKSTDGGAITAALFLQEFVPEGVKWAHLDVAGTAFGKSSWRYLGPGGRGIMVRTFLRLAQRMSETNG